MREATPLIMHVADGEVVHGLTMLRRTMRAIEGIGLEQKVLVLDHGGGLVGERRLPELVPEGEVLRCAGAYLPAKERLLQQAFSKASRQQPVYAVHFHGLRACLLGARAVKGAASRSRLLFSPHLYSAAWRWQIALAGRLLRPCLTPFDRAAVTASLAEAGALSQVLGRSPEAVPYPVAGVFFEEKRCDRERPSVIAAGIGSAAVDAASRLSVLLNGRDARVPIAWLGCPPAGTRERLGAAAVPVVPAETETQAAKALRGAAAFIHIALPQHAALPVAQAMACGVPCLVSDTAEHRALVRHGETGYVCASERELIERLVFLLRNRKERRRMGEAARADAERCFSVAHFERAIRRVYGLTSEPAHVS